MFGAARFRCIDAVDTHTLAADLLCPDSLH
jgi:hypothetical protein